MGADERIFRSRRVVLPSGTREAAIRVRDEKITAILDFADFPPSLPVEDFGDRVIMPGLVDTHVHINEPGRTEWEGFRTATRAAVAGGVTTLIDMPLNCSPVTTSPENLQAKLAATAGKLWADCGFWGGVVPGNHNQLRGLAAAGVRGFKAFLVPSGLNEFPNVSPRALYQALPIIAEIGLPLLVHAELPQPQDQPPGAGAASREYADYLRSRPKRWEHAAIRMLITASQKSKCPIHIVHLASAGALPLLRRARAAGLRITAETCPHYLYFSEKDIAAGDTRFKCAPPIRDARNRQALWQGLVEGDIDLVASDHSPTTPERKLLDRGDFFASWGGIASLGLTLAIVWEVARERRLPLSVLAEWLARRPAALAGLAQRKGALAPGRDADFVVWDPEKAFTVTEQVLHFRHRITPYLGQRFHGAIHRTYLRGRVMYDGGEFATRPAGRLLLHG